MDAINIIKDVVVPISTVLGAFGTIWLFITKLRKPVDEIKAEVNTIKGLWDGQCRINEETEAKLNGHFEEDRAAFKEIAERGEIRRNENTLLLEIGVATLDGLMQLKCNGNVKKMHSKMADYNLQRLENRA